jgi:GntR family transcriptional repressor for pyruvate dehydrogenase complex
MFEPYKGRRAFEDIAEQIKDAILSRRLNRGDRLPSERDLAEQFQVGRVTIREAFRTLETMGLIQVKKGSSGGAFVRMANPDAMASMIMDRLQLEGTTHDEFIEARVGIECAIMSAVIEHATPKDLALIIEDIEVSKEILGPEHAEEVVTRMVDFHILLGEISHNFPYKMIIRFMMQWATRKLRNWVPSPKEQVYSYQSHQELYDAIEARDDPLARRLIREHVEDMGLLVLEHSRTLM